MVTFFLKEGRIVKFIFSGKIYTGKITKRLFPGYEYKNTNKNILRYWIEDLSDPDHSWLIEETKIIDPPVLDIKCGKVPKPKRF